MIFEAPKKIRDWELLVDNRNWNTGGGLTVDLIRYRRGPEHIDIIGFDKEGEEYYGIEHYGNDWGEPKELDYPIAIIDGDKDEARKEAITRLKFLLKLKGKNS